jgi:hypothetical protein
MMTRLAFALTTALLGALPLSGRAETGPGPMPFTYQMFEAAVPHVDMAVCPVDLAAEARFCRVALFNDQIHVFVFHEDGDQPMVDYRAWEAELLTGLMD